MRDRLQLHFWPQIMWLHFLFTVSVSHMVGAHSPGKILNLKNLLDAPKQTHTHAHTHAPHTHAGRGRNTSTQRPGQQMLRKCLDVHIKEPDSSHHTLRSSPPVTPSLKGDQVTRFNFSAALKSPHGPAAYFCPPCPSPQE